MSQNFLHELPRLSLHECMTDSDKALTSQITNWKVYDEDELFCSFFFFANEWKVQMFYSLFDVIYVYA